MVRVVRVAHGAHVVHVVQVVHRVQVVQVIQVIRMIKVVTVVRVAQVGSQDESHKGIQEGSQEESSPSAFVATRMILAQDICLWQTRSMKVPTSR